VSPPTLSPPPEAGEHLFDELKRYVDFSAADEARLRAIGPRALPHIPRIADDFYAHILKHPGARLAITGGDAQVERLKVTLQRWMEGLFTGPWDHDYYELRARIGRRHVAINLPQQYMFSAVNVIRGHMIDVVLDTADSPHEAREEVRSLNRLLDMELAVMLHTYREDSLARIQQSERLATFGQLVASIAHELRNPLGVIESSLFLVRRRLVDPPESITRHMDKIDTQVKVSNRIITNLLDMVRDRPPTRKPVALAQLITAALDSTLLPASVTITRHERAGLPALFVDPDHLTQVLVNLIHNAIDAMHGAGELRFDASAAEGAVTLLVNDSGPGLDPSVRARLFEPLVSTKARGIGLGLALCRRLVERNGGAIALVRGQLPGAAFELTLPLAPTAESPRD
jgi:signal transduction histidine kinase